jgi:nucleoside-diphosphate-sugar epimerase
MKISPVTLREALPRMAADFAVTHIAAIASLAVSVYVHLKQSPGADVRALLEYIQTFYLTRFLPLSAIFPLIFSLNGLYSTSRGYALHDKYRVVLRSAGLATLVYLFANFILTPRDLMPRSSILIFAALTSAGLVGARWLKGIVWNEEQAQAVIRTSSQSERNKPILVVGGAGYIGSMLCHLLIEKGRKVRVLDSLVYGDSAIRDLLNHPDFELQQGDCRNIQHVVKAFSGVKSVIHLAAIVGDPACDLDQTSALEVNYSSTRMMIEIAKGQRIERFLFASSCSVYGATDVLMDENSAIAAVSLYGRTKVDSERALLDAANSEFHPVILRLATVFGNSFRPRFDLVVNLLTAQAFKDGVITICNGQQWRPFIHVRDACLGLIGALDSPLSVVSGEILNLGDDRLNSTLWGVAEEVGAIFPETRIERVDNGDIRNYRVSFGKIRGRIGFHCTMTLADGIRELKTAFETGLIADYRDILYHNQRFLAKSGSPGAHGRLQTDVMAAFAAGARR